MNGPKYRTVPAVGYIEARRTAEGHEHQPGSRIR